MQFYFVIFCQILKVWGLPTHIILDLGFKLNIPVSLMPRLVESCQIQLVACCTKRSLYRIRNMAEQDKLQNNLIYLVIFDLLFFGYPTLMLKDSESDINLLGIRKYCKLILA